MARETEKGLGGAGLGRETSELLADARLSPGLRGVSPPGCALPAVTSCWGWGWSMRGGERSQALLAEQRALLMLP